MTTENTSLAVVTDPGRSPAAADAADQALLVDARRSVSGIRRFEEHFRASVDAGHAVAVRRGTTALQLAARALELAPGDEVIGSALTFQTTLTAFLPAGVVVRFADVDPVTLCLDPASVAALIGPRTRAIATVHYAGLCGGVAELRALADEHGLVLVENCAHAVGATAHGRAAGAWGDIACWNLSSLGCGGMLTARDGDLARRLRHLRARESDAAPEPPRDGTPFERLPGLLAHRDLLARILDDGLAGISGVVTLPVPAGHRHARSLYAFRLVRPGLRRDDLLAMLADRGIDVVRRSPPLLPERRETGGGPCAIPETERLWFRELVTLPIAPDHTPADVLGTVDAVADCMAAPCGGRRAGRPGSPAA